MRVTYNREMKIKQLLDEIGIDNFVPMRYTITGEGAEKKKKLVPAIHNLIFVKSRQETLTSLKMTRKDFDSMRYIVRPGEREGEKKILCVPDKQMDNFMRVASVTDDSVMFLDYCDGKKDQGVKVKIISGNFAGVTGVVKRIKKNKHVVVYLEDLAAVVIAYLRSDQLEVIDEKACG